MKINTMYKVDLIESERGWGQRTDETKYFETEKEALAFVKEYNSANTATRVPDWYMYAAEPIFVEVEVDGKGKVIKQHYRG
jgi:hypothetical protein